MKYKNTSKFIVIAIIQLIDELKNNLCSLIPIFTSRSDFIRYAMMKAFIEKMKLPKPPEKENEKVKSGRFVNREIIKLKNYKNFFPRNIMFNYIISAIPINKYVLISYIAEKLNMEYETAALWIRKCIKYTNSLINRVYSKKEVYFKLNETQYNKLIYNFYVQNK